MLTGAWNVCANNLIVLKLVYDLSTGAISDNLERTVTLFQGQAIL